MFSLEDKTFKHGTSITLLKGIYNFFFFFENHIVDGKTFKLVMICNNSIVYSIIGSTAGFHRSICFLGLW